MELEAVIKARRSVRRYSDRPVPREVVDRCIEAARLAPSACNSQPWHFIVVDDPESRALLAEAAFTGAYAMNGFAKSAPVLVVVVTLPSKVAARVGGLLRGVRYNLVDIGIAGEHFALQAAAEGLGTCWLGWFSAAGVKKALGLPRRARIDVVFSLGYAADEPPALPSARRPLEEVREYRAVQR
ncbi:MAG: nitroreductase [Lentisphaerae bacterium]|nr:nitroreductase [Lentisphaerota bacterium]